MAGIFKRSALGTDDAGPTTQTLICPKGQAFVEGKCVDNMEQPPSPPAVKADTITTTTVTPAVPAPPPAAPPVAASKTTSIPWGWIALGVAALGGAWWVMGKGQEKGVRRNGASKFRKGQVVEGHAGSGSHYSDHFRGVVVSVRGDKILVDTGSGIETTSASKLRRVRRSGLK